MRYLFFFLPTYYYYFVLQVDRYINFDVLKILFFLLLYQKYICTVYNVY